MTIVITTTIIITSIIITIIIHHQLISLSKTMGEECGAVSKANQDSSVCPKPWVRSVVQSAKQAREAFIGLDNGPGAAEELSVFHCCWIIQHDDYCHHKSI
jgi:hypothetical protein